MRLQTFLIKLWFPRFGWALYSKPSLGWAHHTQPSKKKVRHSHKSPRNLSQQLCKSFSNFAESLAVVPTLTGGDNSAPEVTFLPHKSPPLQCSWQSGPKELLLLRCQSFYVDCFHKNRSIYRRRKVFPGANPSCIKQVITVKRKYIHCSWAPASEPASDDDLQSLVFLKIDFQQTVFQGKVIGNCEMVVRI